MHELEGSTASNTHGDSWPYAMHWRNRSRYLMFYLVYLVY